MSFLNKEVVITDEAIKKLFKVPAISALSESIWNALDAKAKNISISIDTNNIGTINTITITDDGEGIPLNKFDDMFLPYQKSWKAEGCKNCHGKKGEGRFKLMALANDITWETSYKDDNNIIKKYSISSTRNNPKVFKISKETNSMKIGTIVTLTNLDGKAKELNTDGLAYSLMAIFALKLKKEPLLSILVNGKKLLPNEFIFNEITGLYTYTIEDVTFDIKYTFIAWNENFKFNDNKHIFFFDENNSYIMEKPSGVQGNFIKHSIFLSSEYFKTFDGFEEWNNKIGQIRNLYREDLLTFLMKIRKKQSKIFYEQFQSNTTFYPAFTKENEEENNALKDIFDVCAFKLLEQDPKLLKTKNHSISMLFKLLQKVIEYEKDVSHIISEVLELDEETTKKFVTLLDSTSLPSLITHYEEIVRKLTFLDVLEELVHDEKYKKKLKERSQLHKIIEKETWIFGSEFENKVGASDKALTAVLKENLTINEVNSDEIDKIEKSLKSDKKEDALLRLIPDLYVWNDFNTIDRKYVHNLIVELKAPKVSIGDKEIQQIEDQRRGIQRNQRYKVSKDNKWTFYIVSSNIKPEVFTEFSGKNNDIIYDKDSNFIVYCKTWDELIRKSKLSLSKQQDELNIQIKEARKEDLLTQYLQDVSFQS